MPVVKPSEERIFLSKHLPEGSVDMIMDCIRLNKVHLKVTRARSGKLGDYIYNKNGIKHTISINHNLHPFQFLITLLHELAHMMVREKYKKRVLPHGPEWNHEFRMISMPFIAAAVFPENVKLAFERHTSKGYASTSVDMELMLVLRSYENKPKVATISDLSNGTVFIYNGRLFRKVDLVRKRYRCISLDNNRIYLFSPLAEIKEAV
jgi:hypothetical protein